MLAQAYFHTTFLYSLLTSKYKVLGLFRYIYLGFGMCYQIKYRMFQMKIVHWSHWATHNHILHMIFFCFIHFSFLSLNYLVSIFIPFLRLSHLTFSFLSLFLQETLVSQVNFRFTKYYLRVWVFFIGIPFWLRVGLWDSNVKANDSNEV